MLSVFTKPLELVTAEDIAELPAQTWPEGYEVEFKRTLPDRRGGQDLWLTGGDIGGHARDEILSEVVAFANAQGGSVVLGIEETPDKPPRAQAVVALPRIGELARRFEDQARSCIDPPLPRLQIRPIETDGPDKGVVIFRTPSSRAAPHRLTTTRESYVRRGSSTVKMTMREIQDMTLNVARDFAGIDATFTERRDAFHKWANPQTNVVAYRVTALPLVDLPDPGRIFGRQEMFPMYREFKATIGSKTFDLRLPISSFNERPRLRGVVRVNQYSHSAFQWELYQNGLSDLWVSVKPWKPPGEPATAEELILCHSEILAAVANILFVLDHYRGQIGAPDTDYGIEIEIVATANPPIIYSGLFAESGMDRWEMHSRPVLLPRLSIGSRSEFNSLLATVDVDIYDALEIRRGQPPPLHVDI